MALITPLMLSRIQFGLTTMFHIIWPVFTIGLSLFLAYLEIRWLRTGDALWYRHARYWGRIFLLSLTVGVATGIPLEFEFGTNWGSFASRGGDFFGHMLGFEASIAFMLEAAFIGIMMFGWHRVSRAAHLTATCLVALGGSLSAFWIMVANSWMHTPTGGYFDGGRFVLTSHMESIFNPDMPWAVSHMWVACLETSLFVVGGLSAWYLHRRRQTVFFLSSFKLAVAAAVIIAPLQVWLGDRSGLAVFEYQPAKLAGIEGHWVTNPPGEGAPWAIAAWPDEANERNAWSLEIPYGLSLVVTHSALGRVTGLRDIPPTDRPPIVIPFYSFRIMMAVGFALAGLMLWTLWAWKRGWLQEETVGLQKRLLLSWMAAGPLSYLAVETGWLTREVGRQPWIIYNLMRTSEGASELPAGPVWISLAGFFFVCIILLTAWLVFAGRIVGKGPEAILPPPPPAAHPKPAGEKKALQGAPGGDRP